MKPFANEPVLELRRAPVRAQLAGALHEHDARPPLRVPVWIGEDRREGEDIVSTDPGMPDRVVATAAAATEADVDAALGAAERGARAWAATPAPGARRGAAARGRVAARAPARGRRAGRARVREAVAGGRRRRLRGDRLPRVLRPRGARHRAGRPGAPGPRRAQRDALHAARRRRRDLALELPDRDPARDGHRRPRDRQRGRAQAGRAVAGLRAAARRRRCARRASRPTRSRCCRARATSARRWCATRACTRSPSPAPQPVGLEIVREAARGAARPEAPQARDRRDGRQELRDRGLRRRPRRGRPRRSSTSAYVYAGPEVLGRRARARPRGDPRRARRAPRRRGRGAATSARPTISRSTSRR